MNAPVEPTTSSAPIGERMVEVYSQSSEARTGTPTIIRILRKSEQRNWQTYRNDCF